MPQRLQNVTKAAKQPAIDVTEGVKIVDVKDALMHEQPSFGPKATQSTQKLQLKTVKVKFGELENTKKLEMEKKFKDEIEQISKV